MNLPGLLGERFYSIYATNKQDHLSWLEFYNGTIKLFGASLDKKLKLVFDILDCDATGLITRDAIYRILSHIPIIHVFRHKFHPIDGRTFGNVG